MRRILMQIVNLTSIHVYLEEHHNQISEISLGETFLILYAAFKKYTPIHVYS